MCVLFAILLLIGSDFINEGLGQYKPSSTKVWKKYGYPPRHKGYYKEYEWIVITRYRHLNMLIFKDVILKLRLAEKLQEKYKGTLSYELGIITAGILETFRRMLDLYESYTNMPDWRIKRRWLPQLSRGFHLIHGCYMEILHDKDMYYAILNDYLAKQKERKDQLKAEAKARYKKEMQDKLKNQKMADLANARRSGEDVILSDREYKRQLRLQKWGEKWDNFNPKVEGIDIDIKVDVEAVKEAMERKKKKY